MMDEQKIDRQSKTTTDNGPKEKLSLLDEQDEKTKEQKRVEKKNRKKRLREKKKRAEEETKKKDGTENKLETKEQRRFRFFRKSQDQVDELKKGDRGPTSGYRLAQLMVAERILHLHEMLTSRGKLNDKDITAVEAHIDFMGLLSEKLSEPGSKAPEEIEQIYQAIIGESHPTKNIRTATAPVNPEKTIENTETAPGEPTNVEFVAGIISAIKRVVLGDETHDVRDYSDLLPIPKPERAKPSDRRKQFTKKLSDMVHNLASPISEVKREIRRKRIVERLAGMAAKADLFFEKTSHVMKESAPVIAISALAKRAGRTRISEKTVESSTKTKEAEMKKPQIDKKVKIVAPELPFELWSTGELLKRSSNIPLGQGRYLSGAYAQGEIDRAGLIKVIKAHKKGLDYRQEFASRSELFRSKDGKTPESLNQVDDRIARDEDMVKDNQSVKAPNYQPPQMSPPASVGSPAEEVRRIAKRVQEELRRQSNAWLLYASISLVAVVIAVVAVVLSL